MSSRSKKEWSALTHIILPRPSIPERHPAVYIWEGFTQKRPTTRRRARAAESIYRLVYNGISLSDKYCPIDKINLVYPSLIRVAEMDATVRQFLKSDGTLVLSHEPTSQRDLGYLKYMDTAAAMGAMSLLGAERALTKNECQAIKDWISAGARSGSETQGEVQDWEQVAQEKAVLLQYYQEMLDRGIIMREKFDEKVRKIVE